MPRIRAHTSGDDITLPSVQIPMLVFLSSHFGHSLWAECESGVLLLSGGPSPEGAVSLPRFRRQ